MAYSGSASDRLTAVRTAIDNCLNAQLYSVRGRQVQRAQLSQLRKLEKELMEEAQQESSLGVMASLGIFTRPT